MSRGCQEGAELLGCPDRGDGGSAVWAWGSCFVGGVGVDELTVDGEVEGVGDDSVDLENGFGGKALVALAAVGDEVGVASVEICGSEGVESYSADAGCDVVVDHPAVSVERWFGEGLFGCEPGGGHEPVDGEVA